jgi:hypothetical protein
MLKVTTIHPAFAKRGAQKFLEKIFLRSEVPAPTT